MEKNILNIKNLKKIYHTKENEIIAVENFTYSLKDGEFVSIVGPSGCGKSTILSILCGLLDKSDGEIEINPDIKLGYMLQNDSLFDFRTILENCLLGLEIKHELTEQNKEYVINLLETYGLKDFINSYPENLSGGMRQRVALIRTLACKPDILLLDEPVSGVDKKGLNLFYKTVSMLREKYDLTIILVSHDFDAVKEYSTRVVLLNKQVKLQGKPKDVFGNKEFEQMF